VPDTRVKEISNNSAFLLPVISYLGYKESKDVLKLPEWLDEVPDWVPSWAFENIRHFYDVMMVAVLVLTPVDGMKGTYQRIGYLRFPEVCAAMLRHFPLQPVLDEDRYDVFDRVLHQYIIEIV
jgi:hypothetical protein